MPLAPTAADLKAAGGSPYYGEMVGVDRSMGALRQGLRKLGIADNTMIWFNSDNGAWMDDTVEPDAFGSNSHLRGHKGELWEGGIRVPGIIEWPARICKPSITHVPAVTSDIYPTIMELLGIKVANQNLPIDGINILPLIDGTMTERPRPIGFWHHGERGLQDGPVVWSDNQYKLHRRGKDTYELYDLINDISEKKNLIDEEPAIAATMKAEMAAWLESVMQSRKGLDYPEKKVLEPEEQQSAGKSQAVGNVNARESLTAF